MIGGSVTQLLEDYDWILMSRLIFIPIQGNDLESAFKQENAVLKMLDCRVTHYSTSVINATLKTPGYSTSPLIPSGVLIVYSLK